MAAMHSNQKQKTPLRGFCLPVQQNKRVALAW